MNDGPLWSGLDLVTRLNARVRGPLPEAATGISIDTRTLKPTDLFFAITGENNDGHDYAAAALQKGAAAAVVDEAHVDRLQGLAPLYIVRDVLEALQRLGRASRERSAARVLAVTGSVGKTSTKEALRLVLDSVGPTHASVASYNNHWGVPLTLARMPAGSRFGIFEIGMNHAGEITPLVALVKPQIAIVTNVGPVHLEFFDGIDGIADAKGEIFSGLEPGGVAIINRDDPTFERLRGHAVASPARHVLTFGESMEAEARLLAITQVSDGSLVKADVLGQVLNFHLGAPGKHHAVNTLAVLLAARASGLDLNAAASVLGRFKPGQGRGAQNRIEMARGAFSLIDESYNANPTSMRAALALLGSAMPAVGSRRIAVLGDMRELGPKGVDLHRQLAGDVRAHDVDLVFAAGPLMRALYDALPRKQQGGWADQAADLQNALFTAIGPGDVVMVKGSNGSRMGPLVGALKQHFSAAVDA